MPSIRPADSRHAIVVGETDEMTFGNVLTETSQLADHYRLPHQLTQSKVIDHLDDGCRDFIARSTFVVVGTSAEDGQDVSPKGGPPGFVKVLDDRTLVIPDMNGNNLLDSLHNIIENGLIGLLFVVPGNGETLRVNGSAVVTTDASVLDRFTDDVRRPTSAIGVTVAQAYIHCAKAFRRGGIWEPGTWPDATCRPSAAALLKGHIGAGLDGVSTDQLEADLEASYTSDLAADRPEIDSPATSM